MGRGHESQVRLYPCVVISVDGEQERREKLRDLWMTLRVSKARTRALRKPAEAGDYRVEDEHGGTDHLVDLDPLLVGTSRQALAVAPGEKPPPHARVDCLFDLDDLATVNELELLDPMLFFQHRPEAALILADGTPNSGAGQCLAPEGATPFHRALKAPVSPGSAAETSLAARPVTRC